MSFRIGGLIKKKKHPVVSFPKKKAIIERLSHLAGGSGPVLYFFFSIFTCSDLKKNKPKLWGGGGRGAHLPDYWVSREFVCPRGGFF